MTFRISGVDFSGLVTSYSLKPRRITGSARGTLLNGDSVADLIITKWDLVMGFASTEEAQVTGLLQTLAGEYVELTLSDPVTTTDITALYEPQLNGVEMAIDKEEAVGKKEKRYWYGFTVNFTAK